MLDARVGADKSHTHHEGHPALLHDTGYRAAGAHQLFELAENLQHLWLGFGKEIFDLETGDAGMPKVLADELRPTFGASPEFGKFRNSHSYFLGRDPA